MTSARRLGLVLSFCALLLSGCSIGPQVIRKNLLRYNDAVAETENEQFLLNIVRLRYRDPPKTLAVGGITSAFDVDATAPTAFTVGETRVSPLFRGLNGPTRVLNILAGQAHYADAPTVSFSPLTTGDFHGGYVSPVALGNIVSLTNTGWDIDRVFRLLVSRMNGLENVPHAAGYGGERVPRFVEFVSVARALSRLQHDGLLELATDPVPVPVADISEPVKVEPPKPADLISAANAHYNLHHDPAQATMTLQSTTTAYDMNLAPEAWQDCDLPEAARLLQLIPGALTYRLLPAEAGHLRRVQAGPGPDIVVSTRSVLSAQLFLSKGIEVPPEHYREGLVGQTLDDEGRPFDWTQVTEGLFRVHASKHKPKNAAVAVKYRGYWFYIADDDRSTKSTFALLLEMFDLQITRALTSSPVLTVPVSAPSGSGAGRRGG
jgi:hypothetical protein